MAAEALAGEQKSKMNWKGNWKEKSVSTVLLTPSISVSVGGVFYVTLLISILRVISVETEVEVAGVWEVESSLIWPHLCSRGVTLPPNRISSASQPHFTYYSNYRLNESTPFHS